jgi:pilus assembly protein CpaB
MKPARLAILAVAVGATTLAGLMLFRKPRVEIREVKVAAPVVQQTVKMTEILVATKDIPMGKVLNAQDMKWQKWPDEALSPHYVALKTDPKVKENLEGGVARVSFIAGEPIRQAKIVKSGSKSFMSAMITGGMRAVSIPVTQETGAGGFILPNDKVDVILVRRLDDVKAKTKDDLPQEARTVLANIRVLAVDQVIEEKNGEKTVLARTATLELSPDQAETLALSKQLGSLSLSLRSVSDTPADSLNAGDGDEKSDSPFKRKGDGAKINIIKFGVSTSATAN